MAGQQTSATPATGTDRVVEHYTNEAQDQLTRVVVVCLDDTTGKSAFHWAVDHFIQPSSDLVVLVHVRQIDMPVAPYINSTGYMDELGEERREESHYMLKHYAAELTKKKIACKAISMVGDPKNEIVRKVAEMKADVVILGSRNFGVLKRAILGSVSDHVAHHSSCTVIIARPPHEGHPPRRRSIFD